MKWMKLKCPWLLERTKKDSAAVRNIATTHTRPSRRCVESPRRRSSITGVSASAIMTVTRCAHTTGGTWIQCDCPLASAITIVANNNAAATARHRS